MRSLVGKTNGKINMMQIAVIISKANIMTAMASNIFLLLNNLSQLNIMMINTIAKMIMMIMRMKKKSLLR